MQYRSTITGQDRTGQDRTGQVNCAFFCAEKIYGIEDG